MAAIDRVAARSLLWRLNTSVHEPFYAYIARHANEDLVFLNWAYEEDAHGHTAGTRRRVPPLSHSAIPRHRNSRRWAHGTNGYLKWAAGTVTSSLSDPHIRSRILYRAGSEPGLYRVLFSSPPITRVGIHPGQRRRSTLPHRVFRCRNQCGILALLPPFRSVPQRGHKGPAPRQGPPLHRYAPVVPMRPMGEGPERRGNADPVGTGNQHRSVARPGSQQCPLGRGVGPGWHRDWFSQVVTTPTKGYPAVPRHWSAENSPTGCTASQSPSALQPAARQPWASARWASQPYWCQQPGVFERQVSLVEVDQGVCRR